MTSRLSFWSSEQQKIQITYDIARAKENTESLIARIDSLTSLGRIKKKDSAEMRKSLKSILAKIDSAGNERPKKK